MKSLSIKKGQMIKEVLLPPSKSYANRALILAALSPESIIVKNLPSATDVTILIQCLEEIGLIIKKHENGIELLNSFPECETLSRRLDVGEGGTTARFLATMLICGGQEYELILGERLKERPWGDFLKVVRTLGGEAELKENRLRLKGPVRFPELLEIDCTETTQFATGFQLLSIKYPLQVNPLNMSSSQSYWEMTESMVSTFRNSSQYAIPMDWSSATYPLAFGAHNHEIFFPGLYYDSLQADSKFYEILSSLGCLHTDERGMTVRPLRQVKSFSLDVSDCLDLVPTLSYFLAHMEGDHLITGFENLIHKESNRLEEVLNLLRIFGRDAYVSGKQLKIKGHSGRLDKQVNLTLPNDHRMVMAGTLFLLHHGGGTVTPSDAVAKSYPEFFSLLG